MNARPHTIGRRARALRALAVAALLLIGAAGSAAAQDAGWLRPFEVSKPVLQAGEKSPYQTSWFPNIVASPDGTVHVIWYSGIQRSDTVGDSSDLLMYRSMRGGRWSDVNNIVVTAQGGYTVRNGIAMGPDGRLHVALRTLTKIAYTSAPWQEAFSARSWSELYPISGPNSAYYTAIAVDSHDTIHVVWSEAVLDDKAAPPRDCQNCANLYYRRSTDGGRTWSPPTNLSNSADGDNRPQIVIDRLDHIHVVWDNGRDWYAGAGVPKAGIYRRSDDGGVTWGAPVRFAPPKRTPDTVDEDGRPKANPDAPQQTTLAVRPDGNPIVVYRTVGGRVYYQVASEGGDRWSPPRQIGSVMARDTLGDYLDKYSLAVDGSGNVHLLMVGYQASSTGTTDVSGAPELLHLTWGGAAWSSPEVVVANDLYPEYPTAIVAGNTLHVVYYTRSAEDRFTSDRAHYRVWYTGRQLAGAAVPALELYTPAPAPEATETPAPTAAVAPTALPTAIAAAPALDRPPAWESEALSVILIAVVPTLLLIGGIAAFVILRRRSS